MSAVVLPETRLDAADATAPKPAVALAVPATAAPAEAPLAAADPLKVAARVGATVAPPRDRRRHGGAPCR